MAAHSSILAWRIPWAEEPGSYGLKGSKELDVTERLSLSLFFPGEFITLAIQSLGGLCLLEFPICSFFVVFGIEG